MQRRKAALKHFDKDGDGRLSEKERKAAKKAVQKRMGEKKPGEQTPKRQKTPKAEE